MLYFDYAASSPLSKKALSSYEQSLLKFGNPSSNHAFGRALFREIENDREKILEAFHLPKDQYRILFTSSATESNNLVIKGIARHYRNRGMKLITSVLEHPSVTLPFKALEKEGFEVSSLPVSSDGKVEPKTLEKSLDKETILVSLIGTNNEIGSVNDLSSLSDIVHRYPKAFFHSDLTQAIGKTPFDFSKLDLFSWSAHKFGGPKGVGGLVFKKNIVFDPLLDGGGQEYGFRSSTLNYPGIVATTSALLEALNSQKENEKKVRSLSSYFRNELLRNPEISINSPLDCSPYILNFSLKTKKASVLVEALSQQEIYLSSVSACSSKGEPISNVLLAIGKSEDDARNSVRVSFSEETTFEEVKSLLFALNDTLERIIKR